MVTLTPAIERLRVFLNLRGCILIRFLILCYKTFVLYYRGDFVCGLKHFDNFFVSKLFEDKVHRDHFSILTILNGLSKLSKKRVMSKSITKIQTRLKYRKEVRKMFLGKIHRRRLCTKTTMNRGVSWPKSRR